MEICLSSATRDAAHPEPQFAVPFSGAAADTAVPPLPPPSPPPAAACGDASHRRPLQPVRPVRPGPSPTPSFASTSRSCSQDEVLQTPDLDPYMNLPLEHPHAHPHSHGAHGLGLGLPARQGRPGPGLGPALPQHYHERDTAFMPPQRTSTPPVGNLSSPVVASPRVQQGSHAHSASSRQRSPTGDNDYGLGFDFTFLAPADQAVIMMAWTAQQPRRLGRQSTWWEALMLGVGQQPSECTRTNTVSATTTTTISSNPLALAQTLWSTGIPPPRLVAYMLPVDSYHANFGTAVASHARRALDPMSCLGARNVAKCALCPRQPACEHAAHINDYLTSHPIMVPRPTTHEPHPRATSTSHIHVHVHVHVRVFRGHPERHH